jgi:hypothetical protein
MKTIKVIELLGSASLLAPEKGTHLRTALGDLLKAGENQITVDFAGYEYLSSTFLNHSIGQLCMDFEMDVEEFRNRITLKGLNDDDIGDANLALQNANIRRKLLAKQIDVQDYYATHLSY